MVSKDKSGGSPLRRFEEAIGCYQESLTATVYAGLMVSSGWSAMTCS